MPVFDSGGFATQRNYATCDMQVMFSSVSQSFQSGTLIYLLGNYVVDMISASGGPQNFQLQSRSSQISWSIMLMWVCLVLSPLGEKPRVRAPHLLPSPVIRPIIFSYTGGWDWAGVVGSTYTWMA